MVSKKNTKTTTTTAGDDDGNDGGVAEYEQSREQRIKENLQRMQKLGIMELSRNLKPTVAKPKPKPKVVRPVVTSADAEPRRSSRIKENPTVSYFEQRTPKEKVKKDVKIVILDGSKPEVYTEEHEKLLGDHKEPWIVGVDGYDDEGNRMYDQYDGKSCHQCRQKTLGFRTKCCKCKTVQGQFCGDCLFQRYGENVEEANVNPDWVCPVCRDICNCSRCRRVKGWEPTGNIFRKVIRLGYKSVAHYLIHTRGPNGKQEDIDNEDLTTDTEGDQLDDKDNDNLDEDGKQLNNKDADNMDEDGKHVPVEKSIKLHDPKKKSKGDDGDADSDYKSDSQDDDDGNDDEDQSSEDD